MGKSAGKWNTSSVIYGGEKECVKYFDGEILQGNGTLPVLHMGERRNV